MHQREIGEGRANPQPCNAILHAIPFDTSQRSGNNNFARSRMVEGKNLATALSQLQQADEFCLGGIFGANVSPSLVQSFRLVPNIKTWLAWLRSTISVSQHTGICPSGHLHAHRFESGWLNHRRSLQISIVSDQQAAVFKLASAKSKRRPR